MCAAIMHMNVTSLDCDRHRLPTMHVKLSCTSEYIASSTHVHLVKLDRNVYVYTLLYLTHIAFTICCLKISAAHAPEPDLTDHKCNLATTDAIATFNSKSVLLT